MPEFDKFIFMKIGYHAEESLEQILERKNIEFKKTGKIFWGYGSTTLHPTKNIKQFIDNNIDDGKVYVLFQITTSKSNPDIDLANNYSINGKSWTNIPDGINVTGSKYALVINEIKPIQFEINLDLYEVGAGPSKGRIASDYLKGRIDKGSFILSDNVNREFRNNTNIKRIEFYAELIPPYAVFLRHKE